MCCDFQSDFKQTSQKFIQEGVHLKRFSQNQHIFSKNRLKWNDTPKLRLDIVLNVRHGVSRETEK